MKVLDVANFFIALGISTPENDITNLKLNKLLYFVQGWSLRKFNRPAFIEDIEAWEYGPVVPEIYTAFKQYGSSVINKKDENYSDDIWTEEEMGLLLLVAREYNRYTSSALINMTHQSNSAWSKVYCPKKHNVIPKIDIKNEFSLKQDIPFFDEILKDFRKKTGSIGYRDENDSFILPAEWDDNEDYSEYLED